MKQILFYLLILLSNAIYGQNLVNNPSFEFYSTCPSFMSQVNSVSDWSAAGYGTPDYFNSCAPLFFDTIAPTLGVSVPMNTIGYQYAATGNGYCGFMNYEISSYREVIISELINPLSASIKYYISFKVSMNEDRALYSGSDNMGLRFTNYDYSLSNQPIIDNVSHVFSNVIISDTLGWQTIQGSFVADSNYQYIMIGNFFDNASTNVTYLNQTRSYYYVDDVCVSTDSLECYIPVGLKNVIKENGISIYPNPNEGTFSISLENINVEDKFEVYNIMGKKIIDNTNLKNENRINLTNYRKGVYLVKITNGDKSYIQRIIYK